jgi:hypothetical protein
VLTGVSSGVVLWGFEQEEVLLEVMTQALVSSRAD